MKIQTKQKYVLLAGMTGFVLGICSANLWMKEYILDIGIFNQFFLEQYNRFLVPDKKQRGISTDSYGGSWNKV